MPVYASRLAVFSKMSGRANLRNCIRAFGIPLCRHSETEPGLISHSAAVAPVPPIRSMISLAVGVWLSEFMGGF